MTDSPPAPMRAPKAVQVSDPKPSEKGPERPSRIDSSPAARFMRFVAVAENGCWIWTGQLNHKGYGLFNGGHNKKWRAHRWSYTHKYGPIPDGLVLDHYACDNPSCVNPDHVRPVTTFENLLRSSRSHAARNAAKTHCMRGHVLPLYNGTARGYCRECKRLGRKKAA